MSKKKAAIQPPPTIIEFLLDETGSMMQWFDQTIAGYADFLDEQRKTDRLCLMTLTKFDTEGLRTPFVDLAIDMVPYLSWITYVPTAQTNLYDTITQRITARQTLLQTWEIKPKVLFVCMTDGEDNASLCRIDRVEQAVTHASDDGWMFVYLGAHERAAEIAINMGFHKDNIRCFQGSNIQATMQEMATATTAYRTTAATSKTFYTAT